ncbi:hypothetical protein VS884_26395, partial [Escherichia coli]
HFDFFILFKLKAKHEIKSDFSHPQERFVELLKCGGIKSLRFLYTFQTKSKTRDKIRLFSSPGAFC